MADKLDVSRQSISKSENNVTEPELNKLVKMSELFRVSLDALVHGDDTKDEEKAILKLLARVRSPLKSTIKQQVLYRLA